MNTIGLYTIFIKEATRTRQVVIQAILSPVLMTFLYFLVFGGAVGSNLPMVSGLSYRAFILPGLIMMSLTMNALMSASSGLYFPRFTGTISDYLTAPLSYLEITLGFALAAVLRALIISSLVLLTAWYFEPVQVTHPLLCLFFCASLALGFAFLGCVIGVWARDFEQLSFIPSIVITPLSFLGGVFYSPSMLPEFWSSVTRLNPLFYIVETLRFCFFGQSTANPAAGVYTVLLLIVGCLLSLRQMFLKGSKLRA